MAGAEWRRSIAGHQNRALPLLVISGMLAVERYPVTRFQEEDQEIASMTEDEPQDHLIRRQEVEALTRLSRSTIYAMMKRGAFPRPIPVGQRAVRWWKSDVMDWIRSRSASSSGQ